MDSTNESTIEDAVLDGKAVWGGIEIAVSDFELGDFDGVLGIEQTELEFLAERRSMDM